MTIRSATSKPNPVMSVLRRDVPWLLSNISAHLVGNSPKVKGVIAPIEDLDRLQVIDKGIHSLLRLRRASEEAPDQVQEHHDDERNQDQEERDKPTNRLSGQGIAALGPCQASQSFSCLGCLDPHPDPLSPGALRRLSLWHNREFRFLSIKEAELVVHPARSSSRIALLRSVR